MVPLAGSSPRLDTPVTPPDKSHHESRLNFISKMKARLHLQSSNNDVDKSEKNDHGWMAKLCTEPPYDLSTLALSFFCPCILVGKIHWRLVQKEANSDPLDSAWRSKFCCSSVCCIAASCFCPWFIAKYRVEIRLLYGIGGRIKDDRCLSCLCCTCVLLQLDREIRAREGETRLRTNLCYILEPVQTQPSLVAPMKYMLPRELEVGCEKISNQGDSMKLKRPRISKRTTTEEALQRRASALRKVYDNQNLRKISIRNESLDYQRHKSNSSFHEKTVSRHGRHRLTESSVPETEEDYEAESDSVGPGKLDQKKSFHPFLTGCTNFDAVIIQLNEYSIASDDTTIVTAIDASTEKYNPVNRNAISTPSSPQEMGQDLIDYDTTLIPPVIRIEEYVSDDSLKPTYKTHKISRCPRIPTRPKNVAKRHRLVSNRTQGEIRRPATCPAETQMSRLTSEEHGSKSSDFAYFDSSSLASYTTAAKESCLKSQEHRYSSCDTLFLDASDRHCERRLVPHAVETELPRLETQENSRGSNYAIVFTGVKTETHTVKDYSVIEGMDTQAENEDIPNREYVLNHFAYLRNVGGVQSRRSSLHNLAASPSDDSKYNRKDASVTHPPSNSVSSTLTPTKENFQEPKQHLIFNGTNTSIKGKEPEHIHDESYLREFLPHDRSVNKTRLTTITTPNFNASERIHERGPVLESLCKIPGELQGKGHSDQSPQSEKYQEIISGENEAQKAMEFILASDGMSIEGARDDSQPAQNRDRRARRIVTTLNSGNEHVKEHLDQPKSKKKALVSTDGGNDTDSHSEAIKGEIRYSDKELMLSSPETPKSLGNLFNFWGYLTG